MLKSLDKELYMKQKIAIGCDHGGFNLKNKIIEYLSKKGVEVKDFGTYTIESCDYPVIAKEVAKEVAAGNFDNGILVCGTGLGMSLVANKVKGIRAVTCFDATTARMSKSHNNANILCLGERITGEYLALDIVETWLKTDFEGGRHKRRVDMFETP